MGVLRYNEKKKEEGKATLLKASGMLPGAENLKATQLLKQFKSITSQNTRTKTNAVHISLNFSPKDQLSEERMADIADRYLIKIGFGEQPYLVYSHRDAGHPHLHLVTTNIDRRGKRIETHNLGKNKSELARKELEISFGLVQAELQDFMGPDLKEMMTVGYGKQPTKAGLNAVLNHVLTNYHFASLSEFNAVLSLFQVVAHRGEKDSLLYKKRGLVFNFLDSNNQRIGVPIKASSFYSRPTLNKLEKRFSRAIHKKSEHKKDVFFRIEKIKLEFQNESKPDIGLFKNLLQRGSIGARLLINESGRLYGVTFIDHCSGCVFKGSELGKELSANALAKQFGLISGTKDSNANYAASKDLEVGDKPLVWLGNQELSQNEFLFTGRGLVLGDISDSPYQDPVFPKKKRKKKKDNRGKETQ